MRPLTFALLAAAALIAGCDDDDPTGGPDGEYYLQITFSPAAAVIPWGGNETINVVVTRGGLYPGAITLTAEGLPAAVTPTFNPPVLTGGNDRATLTLTAGTTAALGPCPFVIRASGPNVEDDVTPTITCAVTQ